MNKSIGILAVIIILAVAFPQRFMAMNGETAADDSVALSKVETNSGRKRSRRAVGYRRGGHFTFNAMLNGRNVRVLVDTGASSVAINRSTAKRIGIRLDDRDFIHTATTANGEAKFAAATIKKIRIDGIVVRNVKAAVLQDTSLNETLLGMSFLNKLRKFEIDGNKITMIQ